MRRVRTLVERSAGHAQFVPFREIWGFSGLLADTFPLDRSLAHRPRWARRGAHWVRLVLVDRAVTNPDRTAYLTVSDTPWAVAAVAAVLAATVAPKLSRLVRVALLAAVIAWIGIGGRGSRYLAMRRELRTLAPDGVLLSDFVAVEPGDGMRWMRDVAGSLGSSTRFVVLVPVVGDERRDEARVRFYERHFGFRRAGGTAAGGQRVAILVRD